MKIAVDTNVLLRSAVGDDAAQMEAAATLLRKAEVVAVSISCLCEFVWVLRSRYKYSHQQIAVSLDSLFAANNVVIDRVAAEAGMAVLLEGGDFADGVIALDGQRMGGDTFVSFDGEAVGLLTSLGRAAKVLS